MGLDATAEHETPDRLADLYAYCAVSVSDDAIKIATVDRSGIDIKSACSQPVRFDRRSHDKLIDPSKINEAHSARSKRRDLVFADPPVDIAPIVQRHIVGSVRSHGAPVYDEFDARSVNHEHSSRDLVGGPWFDAPITVYCVRFEMLQCEAPSRLSGTADKNPTAQYGRTHSSGRQPDKIRGNYDVRIALHVPKRKCALQDINAVFVGLFLFVTGICGDDVQIFNLHVAAADGATTKKTYAADCGDGAQGQSTQAGHGFIVPDGQAVGRYEQGEILNQIVSGEAHPITLCESENGRPNTVSTQSSSRRQSDFRHVVQVFRDSDHLNGTVGRCRDQLLR